MRRRWLSSAPPPGAFGGSGAARSRLLQQLSQASILLETVMNLQQCFAESQDIVPDARLAVPGRHLDQLRLDRGAVGDCVRAAGAEHAARGWGERARHLPSQHRKPATRGWVWLRRRLQQRDRVRVQWAAVDRLARRRLHHPAEIHHHHPVADILNHRQIMRDEQHRQPERALQIQQKVQHLRLHRDVQRRDGFVRDDEDRLDRQRPGDADALALTAGELVRVAVHCVRRQPDLGQHPGDALSLVAPAADAVDDEGLANDVADFEARVQAGIGVLEDHLHVPPERPQRRLVEMRDVGALEAHRTTGRLEQPQDSAARGGLAAAGLADQPEHLASRDRQAQAIDGAQTGAAVAEQGASRGEGDAEFRRFDDRVQGMVRCLRGDGQRLAADVQSRGGALAATPGSRYMRGPESGIPRLSECSSAW